MQQQRVVPTEKTKSRTFWTRVKKELSELDTIMFAYSEAVEKSKAIPPKIKEYMKMANSYWIGFEKYIIGGIR